MASADPAPEYPQVCVSRRPGGGLGQGPGTLVLDLAPVKWSWGDLGGFERLFRQDGWTGARTSLKQAAQMIESLETLVDHLEAAGFSGESADGLGNSLVRDCESPEEALEVATSFPFSDLGFDWRTPGVQGQSLTTGVLMSSWAGGALSEIFPGSIFPALFQSADNELVCEGQEDLSRAAIAELDLGIEMIGALEQGQLSDLGVGPQIVEHLERAREAIEGGEAFSSLRLLVQDPIREIGSGSRSWDVEFAVHPVSAVIATGYLAEARGHRGHVLERGLARKPGPTELELVERGRSLFRD